ncbi:hypothetical protein [Pantoea sp. X85]|uniref:hypothetical protein n=1 Tax=Pantoea sp. X85 TaxID=3037258 RepID=UPI002413C5E4|nr:hypothetical protein [Pantoea sp. X85]WFL66419.1 hypothetical protein P6287_13690 [Pantoea sp. X85]
MTNQQLKAHCEDVIANPQGHLDWVVDMARVALASLEAKPVFFVEIEGDDWTNSGRIEGDERPDLGLLPEGINHLYAAPPLPELKLPEKISCNGFNPKEWDEARSLGQCEGWNACIYDFKRLNGVKS